MNRVGVAGVPARTLTYTLPDVRPFGIYQPAIPEWQGYAYGSLIKAQQPVRTYVDGLHVPEGSGDRFEINEAYALTYVERRDTKDIDDLDYIALDEIIERVGNLLTSNEVISVPITGLKWWKSHIVAPFKQGTYEFNRLLSIQRQIDRILSEAGMEGPPVNRPHHTSLSGFRFQPETIPLHTRIYNKHRKHIVGLINERLTAAGIDTVELGGLMVGNNYTTPYKSGNWMTNKFVEVISRGSGEAIAY